MKGLFFDRKLIFITTPRAAFLGFPQLIEIHKFLFGSAIVIKYQLSKQQSSIRT